MSAGQIPINSAVKIYKCAEGPIFRNWVKSQLQSTNKQGYICDQVIFKVTKKLEKKIHDYRQVEFGQDSITQ